MSCLNVLVVFHEILALWETSNMQFTCMLNNKVLL